MAEVFKETFEYITDKGEIFNILISYEVGLDYATPQQRLTLGGFPTSNNNPKCLPTMRRRQLKPRWIKRRFGTGDNAKEYRVWVKTPQLFQQLINQDQTTYYCGECSSC